MAPKPKFVIQPFKHSVQMDADYAVKTWNTLRDAIHEIHRQNASGLSFEELYRNAYNMVLHKYGDKLYNGLDQTIKEHLQNMAAEVSDANDQTFLSALNKKWGDHKLSMIMIRDILMYMDRTYVIQNKKTPVYELGLGIFRDEVARNNSIQNRLLNTLLELVYKERTGEMIDRGLFKNITTMLVDLGRDVYIKDFEKPFLDASGTFYEAESNQYISENSASDYMKKAERRLQEEQERVNHYLDTSTEAKIRETCEREMIAKHMKTLAEMENSGCVAMFQDNKVQDLARAYELFRRVQQPVSGLGVIRDIMSDHVRELGKSLVEDEEHNKDPVLFVQELLNLRDKFDKMIVDAFQRDKQFHNTLNRAFEYFINLNSRSPEFISLFLDDKLRKGIKGESEDDVELILDKVIMLFRYLQEKDVFEKYYKQHLAKRLLGGRSMSDDAERSMIGKLKTECGYQFTSKLEGMFQDIKLSSDMMDSFRTVLGGTNKIGGIELNVQVLTTGFWPTQSVSKCTLPPEIVSCTEVFKKHYLKRHNGRRLTWQTNMGNADLKAQFGSKKHEINVSTYQMCILLLFNTQDTYTYKEILQATEIPVADLKRALQSLACAKFKILNKEPKSREIDEEDNFSYNASFTTKQIRFKIGTVTATKETDAEKQDTRQKVDEDRKPQIEAAIVRIMKSRKTMEHNNLIAEVTAQLSARFVPHPNMIKKRIESLIEREFLERDKTNWRVYKYLA